MYSRKILDLYASELDETDWIYFETIETKTDPQAQINLGICYLLTSGLGQHNGPIAASEPFINFSTCKFWALSWSGIYHKGLGVVELWCFPIPGQILLMREARMMGECYTMFRLAPPPPPASFLSLADQFRSRRLWAFVCARSSRPSLP